MDNSRKLSKALVGKFEMVGFLPGEFRIKGMKYDTRTMSAKDANSAIAAGATFLKKVEKQEKSSKKASEDKA